MPLGRRSAIKPSDTGCAEAKTSASAMRFRLPQTVVVHSLVYATCVCVCVFDVNLVRMGHLPLSDLATWSVECFGPRRM